MANFNPRSPRGGATKNMPRAQGAGRISIHAPHEGERLDLTLEQSKHATISIHAPHEGERPVVYFTAKFADAISIHAPHEGERPGRAAVSIAAH